MFFHVVALCWCICFNFDSSVSPSTSNDSVRTLCVVGGLNDTASSALLTCAESMLLLLVVPPVSPSPSSVSPSTSLAQSASQLFLACPKARSGISISGAFAICACPCVRSMLSHGSRNHLSGLQAILHL
ncbi:hypothetical protein SCLCIDRAFT_32489 [Scleroderma citrinum Foug A]|uniref:Secreted protein n=1 Tax=Scleroderma citrinum Foug A TaxID=1036808 RepID=A0A0C3D8E3_9AGAM|nr:hypothetical protein SCLCIDRAFT_32489 [Scleroderma citrinum Foug A]